MLPSSGKEAPNLIDPKNLLFSVTGHPGNSRLVKIPIRNRSSPRIVTGKWLLKNKN